MFFLIFNLVHLFEFGMCLAYVCLFVCVCFAFKF